MRIFARVVERGSMSEAARDLGLSQSSISERIDRLERHLGVRLMHRSPRALVCTDEGAEFYSRCKDVLAAADEACAAVTQRDESLRGAIRIASAQCFGEVVLPQVISRIQKRHPNLRVDVVLNDRIIDPVTEGVDVSFRLGSTIGDNIIAIPLGYIHRTLLASAAYVARNPPIASPGDLAHHPFIHVKGLFANASIALEEPGRAEPLQVPISPAITTSHWRPMYELIMDGAGIGIVQSPGSAKDLADGRLVRLLPDYEVPKFELTAIIPVSRPVPSKVRAIVGLMKQYLPEVPGYSPEHAGPPPVGMTGPLLQPRAAEAARKPELPVA
ncbi:LysR family transcriptional regulator [Luteimonas aquatica]|uniref:LysR family transcriptional regulator n=1 Tax=Luteimonas aquatica TaxID=450364 RepID=UPI001F586494|nr:LysR family transcriptional regulator [Luteimonas aquatica]